MAYNKLKAYFVENGIKQKEVAELLGVSRVTLSYKLNRYRNSDFMLKEVRTLCSRYNLPADEFFDLSVSKWKQGGEM